MIIRPIEADYPISFRKDDSEALSDMIKRHQSVEFIGMKRVGISNFLRFFLYNPKVKETYFGGKLEHEYLFVPIDFNNLIERERYPFWLLTFKRILDAVESAKIDEELRLKIEKIFDTAIQHKDTFFIVDGIRKALAELTKKNIVPVLFMIRFDRLLDIITPELFANIQGLYDACNGKLVYVFTSYRKLIYLKPEVFDKNTMSIFSHPVYMQPAGKEDMDIILSTFEAKYEMKIAEKTRKELIKLSGGHVNYLQLSLIILNEEVEEGKKPEEIMKSLSDDERIELQSEELFSYLQKEDQDLLTKIASGKGKKDDGNGAYVWKTGMIVNGKEPARIFSPLFESYISNSSKTDTKAKDDTYLTNKEHKLFTLLKEHLNEICERDLILDTVWAEYEAIGVSDWAVDRLVARLRKKLKEMDSEYRIRTIRTRGFMLIQKSE